jgi:hypothetical protein
MLTNVVLISPSHQGYPPDLDRDNSGITSSDAIGSFYEHLSFRSKMKKRSGKRLRPRNSRGWRMFLSSTGMIRL